MRVTNAFNTEYKNLEDEVYTIIFENEGISSLQLRNKISVMREFAGVSYQAIRKRLIKLLSEGKISDIGYANCKKWKVV